MSTYKFTKIEQNTSTRQTLADGMISLSKTGRIGLGRRFTEKYNIDTDSRANLYWDSSSKAIAMSFKKGGSSRTESERYVKVQPSEGYTVGFVKGDAGYVVSSNFFKQIGVDPSEHTGQYRYDVVNARDAGITDAGGQVFVVRLEPQS